MNVREIYRYDRKAGAVVRKPEPQQFIEMLPCLGDAREFRDLQDLMQIGLAEMGANIIAGKPAVSTVSGVLRVPTGMSRQQYYDTIMAQYAECWARQIAKLLPPFHGPDDIAAHERDCT